MRPHASGDHYGVGRKVQGCGQPVEGFLGRAGVIGAACAEMMPSIARSIQRAPLQNSLSPFDDCLFRLCSMLMKINRFVF